jgi:hypothetical protein
MGIALERGTSFLMLINSVSFSKNKWWKWLFCLGTILSYTDILTISWIKNKNFKSFTLLQNYR